MAKITKEDLENRKKHKYFWAASLGDNPNITGKQDSQKVNRKEGYEVLYFINAFMEKHDLGRVHAGKIEDALHECKDKDNKAPVMRDEIIRLIEKQYNERKPLPLQIKGTASRILNLLK